MSEKIISLDNLSDFKDNADNYYVTQKNLQDLYNSTKTYAVGDLVFYRNVIYKCIVAVASPEAFDASKWRMVQLDDLISATPAISDATITIKQTGQNDQTFTLNGSAKTITLTDDDTNYYPSAVSWTNGTSAGPTGIITVAGGGSNVSIPAIPIASASQSGVVTTGEQTLTGNKTFTGSLVAQNLAVAQTLRILNSDGDVTRPVAQLSNSGLIVGAHWGEGLDGGTIYGNGSIYNFEAGSTYYYNFPSKSGAIALTSDIKPTMVSTTWSELKALRDGGTLVPGQQYRITDYQCTTAQADTFSMGHAFDIIVTADSNNKLNEKARAILHAGDTYFANNKLEAWQLWYSLDNDTNKFAWADSTNGKGVIYRMVDEFGNDVPYDFKNIIFEFKQSLVVGSFGPVAGYTYIRNDSLDTGGYYGWTTAESVSYGAPTNVFTNTQSPSTASRLYSNTSGSTMSSTIKMAILSEFGSYTFNAIVDSDNIDASLLGYSVLCYSNIIGTYILNGEQALNKTVFRTTMVSGGTVGWYSNTIAGNNWNNVFSGSSFESNNIGHDFQLNTITHYFQRNTVGPNFQSNTISSTFHDNTIGSYFQSNTISYGFASNIFGNDCSFNTFSHNCDHNIFGNYCSYNTLGSACENNIFGNYCSFITFGNSSSAINYCSYNTIDSGCAYLYINSTDTSASGSNRLKNVHIHAGVRGTSQSSRKTITIPDRNLPYETNVYMDADGNIKLVINADMVGWNYSDTKNTVTTDAQILTDRYLTIYDDNEEGYAARPTNSTGINDPDVYLYSTGITIADGDGEMTDITLSYPSQGGVLGLQIDIDDLTQINN